MLPAILTSWLTYIITVLVALIIWALKWALSKTFDFLKGININVNNILIQLVRLNTVIDLQKADTERLEKRQTGLEDRVKTIERRLNL